MKIPTIRQVVLTARDIGIEGVTTGRQRQKNPETTIFATMKRQQDVIWIIRPRIMRKRDPIGLPLPKHIEQQVRDFRLF